MTRVRHRRNYGKMWFVLQVLIITVVGGTLTACQVPLNPLIVGLISIGVARGVTEVVTTWFTGRPAE